MSGDNGFMGEHVPSTGPRLEPASGIDHGPACGTRIPSPHPGCQVRVDPYLGAERQVRSYGEIIIICNVCHGAWQEFPS